MKILEIHQTNDFYDHARILKEYCGYPKRLPLPVSIQHGHYIRGMLPFEPKEVEYNPEEVWVWSEGAKKNGLETFPNQEFRVVGCPAIYLNLNEIIKTTEPEGTLVFWPRLPFFDEEILKLIVLDILKKGYESPVKLRIHDDKVPSFIPSDWVIDLSRKPKVNIGFYDYLIKLILDSKMCVFFSQSTAIYLAAALKAKVDLNFRKCIDFSRNSLDKRDYITYCDFLSELQGFDDSEIYQKSLVELGFDRKLSDSQMLSLLLKKSFRLNHIKNISKRIYFRK